MHIDTQAGDYTIRWCMTEKGNLFFQADGGERFQHSISFELSPEQTKKIGEYLLTGSVKIKYGETGTPHKIDSIFDLKKIKKDNKKVLKMFRKLRKELKKSFR